MFFHDNLSWPGASTVPYLVISDLFPVEHVHTPGGQASLETWDRLNLATRPSCWDVLSAVFNICFNILFFLQTHIPGGQLSGSSLSNLFSFLNLVACPNSRRIRFYSTSLHRLRNVLHFGNLWSLTSWTGPDSRRTSCEHLGQFQLLSDETRTGWVDVKGTENEANGWKVHSQAWNKRVDVSTVFWNCSCCCLAVCRMKWVKVCCHLLFLLAIHSWGTATFYFVDRLCLFAG